MKKTSRVMQYIFAVGVLVALVAGAGAFVGYVVALLAGGTFAEELCVFIFDRFFPVVIRFCSISVGVGLVSMYLGKMKALSFSSEENEE